MKLLIIWHARHWKDTLAEQRHERYWMTYKWSSERASEIFLYEKLKDKYWYSTPKECFLDRWNHRAEWCDEISKYNKDDPARLAKDILRSSDCYVWMRSEREIMECARRWLFDLVIWVDALDRLPPEDSSSFDIQSTMADIVISNNWSMRHFIYKSRRLWDLLFKQDAKS